MFVLDTHVWYWWFNDERRLSKSALEAIESSQGVGLATISCLELATLVRKGRIGIDGGLTSWIIKALAMPGLTAIPLEATTAIAAGLLDARSFPADPADRMIYATARSIGATLITKDQRLRDFDPRGTLW